MSAATTSVLWGSRPTSRPDGSSTRTTPTSARESFAQLHGERDHGLIAPVIALFEQRPGPEKFQSVWNE